MDGVDFIVAFAKKFHVDVSQFNPGVYFGNEPPRFTWLSGMADLSRVPRLTFIDLASAAETRTLCETSHAKRAEV